MDNFLSPVPYNISMHDEAYVDMMIDPLQTEHVKGFLNCSNMEYTVSISDLQEAIEKENVVTEAEDEILVGRPGKVGR